MEQVPDELKIQILSYLPLSDLSQVALVSRYWLYLALDHVSLWVCMSVSLDACFLYLVVFKHQSEHCSSVKSCCWSRYNSLLNEKNSVY